MEWFTKNREVDALSVDTVSDVGTAWPIINSFNCAHPGTNPFVQRAWLETWLEHFRPADGHAEFLIFRARDEEVVGYLPCWVTQLPLGPEVYRFMDEGGANSLDFPCSAPVGYLLLALKNYFRTKKRGVIFRFYDVDEHSILAKALAGTKSVFCVRLYPCPRVDLSDGWETYAHTRLTSKRRSELRRLDRRLSALGPLGHIVIRNTVLLVRHAHLVEQLFELHRLRFERVLNTSGFGGLRMQSFYKKLITRTAQEGTLYLSIMTIGDQAVSFVLGFVEANRLIDCIPAFDPSLAPFGIGHIHLHRIMRELPGQGINIFDFSKGDSVYKAKWATSNSANLLIAVPYHLPLPGYFWLAILNGKDALRVQLRRWGVMMLAKRLLGTISYWRKHPLATASPKLKPLLFDPSGIDLTQPVLFQEATKWTPAVKLVVFRALARGAAAYVAGKKVVMIWPNKRTETINIIV